MRAAVAHVKYNGIIRLFYAGIVFPTFLWYT